MRLFLSLLCCGLLSGLPLHAATPTPADAPPKDETIDVTADQSLEWYQDQQLYVARGNAKAVRGATSVEADVLTAHARDKDAEPQKQGTPTTAASPQAGGIDKLTAEGHVHITNPREQIFGEHGTYDMDTKTAKVTGEGLKYATESDVVTAKDSLEYYENEGIAVARGHAVAVHEKRHIEGDVLTAYFSPTTPNAKTGKPDKTDSDAPKEMSHMTAEGNVLVVTETDISRGDHATYDNNLNTAILTGHVRITREGTQLTGDRAIVNFDTGESRLLNDGNGRVHALLTPKASTEKSGPKKAAAKADHP